MAPGFLALAPADPSSAKLLGEPLVRDNYRTLTRNPPRVLSVSTPSTVNVTNRLRLKLSNETLGVRRSIRGAACMAAGVPYDVLGVNPNASAQDIKKAYDKKFQEINEAYEVLKETHSGNYQEAAHDLCKPASQRGPRHHSASYYFWKVLNYLLFYFCLAFAIVSCVGVLSFALAFTACGVVMLTGNGDLIEKCA